MWNLLGRMFGTDKALERTVDTVSNGLDKLVYTDEERADNAAKERSEARSMVIRWMEATQGQNLARRFLALIITLTWLSQYIAMQGLALTAVWADDPQKWSDSSALIGSFAESMNGAMMLILGFYFAAPHLSKIVDGAMNKFGKSNGS